MIASLSRAAVHRVVLGPALGLVDDEVDHAEGDLVHGRHLHRRRGGRRLVGVAPQDRRATLGRDDRVDGVLEGDHDVPDRDRERTAGTALAGDDGHDRRPQAAHQAIERAIASAIPRSSDSGPGWAPGTSMKVTTGIPRRSASSMSRIDLR